MAARLPMITQRGLGTDEGDEAALVDAWWNPPPSQPVSCPSTIPPTSETIVRRCQTISLEELDEMAVLVEVE